MKVLMFGWEFPPKIYGGLAVASYGITKGLSLQGDMETIFCMPKPSGEEEKFLKIIGMNQVPIVWRDVNYDYLKSRLLEMTPEEYYSFRDHIYADFSYMHVNDLGCMEFAGGYPGNLHEEINNFSIIAGVVARQQEFDIIHAHDWLTYPAGVHAKMVSGKPLCIHVHATDFDRSRGKVNPTVYSIEKNGMDHADCIMCVSELTRRTVINEYHQDPRKVFAMHNAVYPLSQELLDIPRPDHSKEKVVTFLGRITMQKGPEYFVEAAALVLQRTRNIRFVMAGSGDMLNAMINLVAERGIADPVFHPAHCGAHLKPYRTRLVLADSKARLVSGCFPPSRTACHTGSLSRGFAKRLLHRVYIDVGRFDRSFQHRRISGGCSCHAFLYGWRNAAKQGCRTCFTKYQPSA